MYNYKINRNPGYIKRAKKLLEFIVTFVVHHFSGSRYIYVNLI